ncbi:MAG: HAD-IIIC family phosphatase [Clostridium sp.]|nr:HAD-IIIC family phosphatase [Clostridium sp.]
MNTSEMMKKARKHNRDVKKYDCVDVKIAVIGSYSIQYFVSLLRYSLYTSGIKADIYEGNYDGIVVDVYDDDSEFYAFNPDIVIILPYYEDIKVFPNLFDSVEEVNELLEKQMEHYNTIWKKISSKINTQILQSNIVIPGIQQIGNLEGAFCGSKINYLKKINEQFYKKALDNVTVLDYELIATNVGKRNWFDYSAYYLTKTGFNVDFLPDVIDFTTKIILSMKGKIRKCLVLDLDNTLWGGVVGDDGYDGIQIDPNDAVGESYRAFQKYVLELKQRGVILAVCSKNEEATAKEPFEKNENMLIKLDDISCFVANWDEKTSNLKEISYKLNIAIDSLVFFDDNPVERELVKQYLPEVMVIDVPSDSANYVSALSDSRAFEWLQLTKEDLIRTNSYVDNQKREALMTNAVNYDEYLRALDTKGKVGILNSGNIERFTQLINKSNQFNLRTKRYTEAEINSFMRDEDTCCLYVTLSDRFSEYGVISCVILRFINYECFIDTWVMSCRVLKRGVEFLMFNSILDIAIERKCNVVIAEYLQTKKNTMVKQFYDTLGFSLMSESEGKKIYKLTELQNRKEHYIKIV